jgi:hypothetical protein
LLSLQACTGNQADLGRKKPDPTQVAELVTHYDFVDPTGPVAATIPLPDGTQLPDAAAPVAFTIARAVPKSSPAPSGKVILALIKSDKPYPHLGIAAGDNYVWRDATNPDPSKWETYMVQLAPAANFKKLKRGSTHYSTGDPTQPRLVKAVSRGFVAFGVCLDDPMCGSGHCGYGDVE